MEKILKQIAQTSQEGRGRQDDVPALLSEGEYIIPADVVSMLGDGSTEAGAKFLDEFIERIRREKQGTNESAPEIQRIFNPGKTKKS